MLAFQCETAGSILPKASGFRQGARDKPHVHLPFDGGGGGEIKLRPRMVRSMESGRKRILSVPKTHVSISLTVRYGESSPLPSSSGRPKKALKAELIRGDSIEQLLIKHS